MTRVAGTQAMDYETQHYDRLADQLASAMPTGLSIPGYKLVRELNRGGQAVVFLATQESTGRRVAVKLLAEGPLARASERARLDREVSILAALHHPHIVSIIDRGATPHGWLYLVMEYIDGKPLDEWLAAARKASADTSLDAALRVFLKVCDAVNVAHVRGIVHRDLKPSNILVDENNEPHVLDFGLARPGMDAGSKDGSPVTQTGQFVGSLPWASPEQAEGVSSRIDIRSDVYSLGVILYQILTGGRFPYAVTGTMPEILQNILSAQATPPSLVLAAADARTIRRRFRLRGSGSATGVAPRLEAIALKALAKRREERYQTAGQLARDVESFLSGKSTFAAGPPRLRMRTALVAAAALAACGAALAAAFYLQGRHPGTASPGVAPQPPNESVATQPAPTVFASPAAVSFRAVEVDNSQRIALAAADLDGDGRPELIADHGPQVEVWPAGGIDGSKPARHDALGSSAGQMRTIVVGDVNADARPDVIVGDWGKPTGNIVVLLNRGRGALAAAANYTAPGPLAAGPSIALGDFDGDGLTDILAAANAKPFPLLLYPGNGDGTFRDATTLFDGAGAYCFSVGDADRDARADFVALGDEGGGPPRGEAENALIVSNRGNKERYVLGGPRLVIPAVADFDRDGRLDVIGAAPHSLGSERHSMEVWLATSTRPPLLNPYLGPRTQAEIPGNSALYAGDFDGDATPDLLLVDADGNFVNLDVLPGRGDGTFHAPQRIRGVEGITQLGSVAAVADFNRDGLDDIALSHERFLGVLVNTTPTR